MWDSMTDHEITEVLDGTQVDNAGTTRKDETCDEGPTCAAPADNLAG
jgi:hypothetical protein